VKVMLQRRVVGILSRRRNSRIIRLRRRLTAGTGRRYVTQCGVMLLLLLVLVHRHSVDGRCVAANLLQTATLNCVQLAQRQLGRRSIFDAVHRRLSRSPSLYDSPSSRPSAVQTWPIPPIGQAVSSCPASRCRAPNGEQRTV